MKKKKKTNKLFSKALPNILALSKTWHQVKIHIVFD